MMLVFVADGVLAIINTDAWAAQCKLFVKLTPKGVLYCK